MPDKLSLKLEDVRKTIIRHSTKKPSVRNVSDITSIGLHHSMTDGGNAFSIARYHVQTNNWPTIGYTYIILPNGIVQWCSNHNEITYHVGNSNRQSLGVCLIGDFRKIRGNKNPTKEQIESLFLLLNFLFELLPNAKKLKGHIEYPGYSWKECPGIDMDKLRKNYEESKKESIKTVTAEKRKVIAEVHGRELEFDALFSENRNHIRMIDLERFGLDVKWIDGKIKVEYKK